MMQEIKVGDVRDFRNFVGAVIDQKAFTKISGYLDDAKKNARVLQGGTAKGDEGYFVQPTLIQDRGSRLPHHVRRDLRTGGDRLRLSGREVARDARVVDRTSPYALTGAIFSRDRKGVREATSALGTPPATSTSTTSPPAPSSASSPSAERAARAPTTRPARS